MKYATKRELNQNTARVLAEVTETSPVIITERGTPTWEVRRYQADPSVLAQLEEAGLYTPPSATPATWPETGAGRTYSGDEIEDIVGEMRGGH